NTAVGDTGKITLTWSAPASNGGREITQYRIYRRANNQETLAGTVSGAFTFIDQVGPGNGLQTGVTYSYDISAVTIPILEGPRSNSLSAVAKGVPLAPTMSPATAGNATVSLSWAAPTNTGGLTITGYQLYR